MAQRRSATLIGFLLGIESDRVQNALVLFADLVAVSGLVEHASARSAKVAQLSAFLRERSPIEVSVLAELFIRAQLFADAEETDDDDVDPAEPRDHSSLTCEEVAEAIAEIDRAPASSFRRSLVHQLLTRATRAEQRWIRAAVSRQQLDRRKFDLVVTSTANAAPVPVGSLKRAVTLSGSLSLAVRIAFERGAAGLDSVTFEPGRPILPALAERADTLEVVLDPSSTALVEWNVDSDRIQVHRLRGEIVVYDEQLQDVTDAVPAVVAQVAALPRGDLVLDGWVDIGGESSPMSPDVAGWTRHGVATRDSRQALFFDVLFDGASVVEESLAVRRELLAAIVPETARVPVLEVADLDNAADVMNEAVRLGYNGLVLKNTDAPYEGGLVRSSWRRINAVHVLKLAVVAADRGTGRRSHLLSSAHLAASDDQGRFLEVGKTARGLTEKTIVWQTGAFAELWLEGDRDTDRLFRLRPELVAVVAIHGIDESNRYPVGLLLRQPRILGYQRSASTEVATVEVLREIADRDREIDSSGAALGAQGAQQHNDLDGSLALPWLPEAAPRLPRATPVLPQAVAGSTREVGAESVTVPLGSAPHPGVIGLRSVADVDFEPYQEPVMLTSKLPERALVVARVAALVWTLAVLLAAVIERSGSGTIDGSAVALIGYAGFVVVGLLTLTGWAWTDQLVRTLTLLDGRRPTRPRCVSAWLLPPLSVILMALVVVPIEPTKPADVRPVLIAVVFGLVMWRPYALIRRILSTLTRQRSDALIVSAYILDVLAFGVFWWRLTLWGQRGDDVSGGEIDILVGTVGALAVAMALSLVVWLGLLESVRKAVAHRRSSQLTRYEHRMLRLRGVDPTDPEIWWALVQRRADEQRDAAAARQAVENAESPSDEGRRELPSVEELIEVARAEHGVAFRQLGDDETLQLESLLRKEFSAIVGSGAAQSERTEPVDTILALDGGLDVTSSTGQPAEAPAGFSGTPQDLSDEDPIDAMRRRIPHRQTNEPTRSDIEVLIGRAGSVQVDAALAAHRKKVEGHQPTTLLVPPRLYAVEAAQLIVVATFGALTLATAWLVTISLSSDAVASTGELPPSVVTDLDLTRRIFWGLFTAAVALVPVWSLVVMRQARRAGAAVMRERRVRVLVVVAVAACVCGFVFDGGDRSGLTLLLSIPIVWSAVAAGLCVEPVRVWFELSATTLTAWIATLPVILGIAWLAGLAAPIQPTASLQRLAFTTILLTLGCARVTVMSRLSSLDLEDEFRITPELAVPARRSRRS